MKKNAYYLGEDLLSTKNRQQNRLAKFVAKAVHKLQLGNLRVTVLQSYEADTWYDARGRIVFTNNKSLVNVGFSRPEWEKKGTVEPIARGSEPWNGIMKEAPEGYVFARTFTDDTLPNGPIERTVEYYAPFSRCDREEDYQTAWNFFKKKLKSQTKQLIFR